MKKILALVLILCLAGYASAVVVEDWDGAEWSPGSPVGWQGNPNGDTVPPSANGWAAYTTWTYGTIGINNGAGYLGTVGAEVNNTLTDFRYYGAWITKDLATPQTSGSITHYALIKIDASADNGYVAPSMMDANPNTKVTISFKGTGGGSMQAATLGVGETNLAHTENVASLGWIAAEMTLSGLGTGTRTFSARYRDVDDSAEGYIGAWIDLGSISDGNVMNAVHSQGFYMGDWGNVWNGLPFGWVDRINDPVPEPATLAVLGLGGLAALLRRRK